MKKYTVRVDKELAERIEKLYGRERQFSVNQGLSSISLNTLLTSCIERGMVGHEDLLDEGSSLLVPDHKSALEVMEELLAEVSGS